MKINRWAVITLTIIAIITFSAQFFIEWAIWKKASKDIQEINSRIELLENAFEENPTIVDSLALEKFALEIQKLEQTVNDNDTTLRNDFYWMLRIGVPATLIALLGLFWGVYKSTYSWALNEAKKAIEKRYKPEDQLLREEKKILVIHHEGADQNGIRVHFLASKFDNVDHVSNKQSELKKYDFKDYDLIMFNNKSKEKGEYFTEDQIQEFIKQARSNTVLFYYNGEHLGKFRADERFSSANFKSQIIPNILNLLKFQDLSKRS